MGKCPYCLCIEGAEYEGRILHEPGSDFQECPVRIGFMDEYVLNTNKGAE